MSKRNDSDGPGGSYPKDRPSMTERYKRAKGSIAGEVADWGTASPAALSHLIQAATAEGGAVLLGYSRDRGAYRIILMDDGDKITEWIPCTTDLDEALYNLAGNVMPPDYQIRF